MMLGRPHTEQLDTLVVTDVRTRETEPARNCIYIRLTLTLSLQVFPLPVEGFETRVIADDEQVINYMIELSEALDESRTERLMGWYHSHPFDVDEAPLAAPSDDLLDRERACNKLLVALRGDATMRDVLLGAASALGRTRQKR